eukprot:4986850-Lingulodinium_polyedra.AAC.1
MQPAAPAGSAGWRCGAVAMWGGCRRHVRMPQGRADGGPGTMGTFRSARAGGTPLTSLAAIPGFPA